MMRRSLLISLCLLAASTTKAEAPAWMPGMARLDALRASLDVPGVAFVALEDCRPLAPVNAGMASLEPGRPVSDRTVFEAASLSKPVFAYLVLQLAEEGGIDLDRPIAQDFAYPRIMDQAGYQKITPRMVLTHRTGLPNWAGASGEADNETPIAFATPPGSAYSYSGEAFELLRAYVDFKTGQSLDALFRERLGSVMPFSAFSGPLAPGAEPARGYTAASKPESGRGLTNLRPRGGAAGGLVVTAADYARFMGRLCAGEGLSAQTYADMFTPQTPVADGEFPFPAAYGLGWAIMETATDTVILHGGNNDEFRAFAGFSRRTREGVVILTNGRYGGDLIDAILEAIQ
jgi:CubicO group peptidase (beta-lactamase class C family)